MLLSEDPATGPDLNHLVDLLAFPRKVQARTEGFSEGGEKHGGQLQFEEVALESFFVFWAR
jgi:hypothetical protein